MLTLPLTTLLRYGVSIHGFRASMCRALLGGDALLGGHVNDIGKAPITILADPVKSNYLSLLNSA